MPQPFFSVVVPTRNRAQLAVPAITRVLEQTWQNFEVVVLENSDQPSLGFLEQQDPRVRVFPSDRFLAMPDNWERGLDLVRGEYVIYLSDKDWMVPFALAEMEAAIRAQNAPAILTVRRAGWFPPDSVRLQGLLMQQGTGQVATLPGAPVLERWFGGVNNLMNAPMIYNSAVRREFVAAVRSRCGGRLFHGSAPDVASGQLLVANAGQYTMLDRVHMMAVMGPWSIGWATFTKGKGGAAASYAGEFGADRLETRGLVWSIAGVIAETLLACQAADRPGLGRYRINWDAYFQVCECELAERAGRGEDVRSDLARLQRGVAAPWLRGSWRRFAFKRELRRRAGLVARVVYRSPLRFFAPPYDGWRRRLGLAAQPERNVVLPASISFLDSECFRQTIPTATPEEAFALVLKLQSETTPREKGAHTHQLTAVM